MRDVIQPSSEALSLLAALHWPGVGVVRARQMASSAERGDRTEYLELIQGIRGAKAPQDSDVRKAEERAHCIAEQCATLGVWIGCMRDAIYPAALKCIADPPPILYVKGSLEALREPCVAVVGTRKASQRGLSAARTVAGALARSGYGIVSGLALGIDTAAHEGALDHEGRTVAVLAHGLETVSPKTNEALAKRLLERNGALVSEHAPGVPARRAEFVRRNRIQSGLSLASVVVESAETGGAIHQARFTRAQGRLLFVVLPDSGEGSGEFQDRGAKALMEELDAIPVSSSKPLLEKLSLEKSSPRRQTSYQEQLF